MLTTNSAHQNLLSLVMTQLHVRNCFCFDSPPPDVAVLCYAVLVVLMPMPAKKTIKVLNGMPFLTYHIEMMERLRAGACEYDVNLIDSRFLLCTANFTTTTTPEKPKVDHSRQ